MRLTIEIRAKAVVEAYRAHLGPGDSVLDVGCGNGVMAEEIRKGLGCKMMGTDIMEYLKTDLPYKPMSEPAKLPFSDGEFSAALFTDALHHMPSDIQLVLIKEALRVSRKVLLLEMRPTLAAKATDWIMNKIHNPSMPIPWTMRDLPDWKRELEKFANIDEARPLEKPFFLYPVDHFVIALGRRPG
jgi:ubiquinone/menaquinone biosynthesis C-methylase UbiE